MKKDDTEQRMILAVLLSLGLYWVWLSLFGPAQVPVQTATVGTSVPQVGEALVQPVPSTVPADPADSALPSDADPTINGVETAGENPSLISAWDVVFDSSGFAGRIGRDGGGLYGLELQEHSAPLEVQPIWTHLWKKRSGLAGEWLPWGETKGAERLVSEEGLFLAVGSGNELNPGSWQEISIPDSVAVRSTNPMGLEITKIYRPDSEGDGLNIEIRWENLGNSHFQDRIWLGAIDRFEGEANRYSNTLRPVINTEDDLETLEDIEDVAQTPKLLESPVSWFGIADRYFIAAAIPESPGWGKGTFAATSDGRQGAFLFRDITLAPGRAETLNLNIYIGSKNLDSLEAVGQGLESSVDFGIFGFFSHILLWILKAWQSLVGNWGLAIILLTVSVKLAFWPLTRKSFESSRKMQRLSPQMAEIKEKYKDDAQKAGQAQMEMFKKEGVNPLAGCLPMFIQMPVWFALYSVLLFAADLYQAEFLYLRDLTSKDPYGILPTLVGVGMVFQQRMTPLSPTMDPMQQKMIRFMPIAFTIIFYTFPSGLALYVLVNTILSMTQMWMVNRAFPVIPQPVPAGSRSK